MSRTGLLLAAAALVSACSTTLFSSGVRTTVYDCPGKQMIVSFNDHEHTASVSINGEPLRVLPERYAPDGAFAYADAAHALRGQRYEVHWTASGNEPMTCYARARATS